MSNRTLAASGLALVLLGSGMTATWALTDEEPDQASTTAEPPIQACMKRANRNLKLAEADGACPPGFKSVEWAVQGPQGEQGQQGIAGPEGAEGPAGPQGEVGPAGPKGDTGATGPAGAPGAAGSGGGPDEYVQWTLDHQEDDPANQHGNYFPRFGSDVITGPAALTAVEIRIPVETKQWIRANCSHGGVGINLGRSYIGWSWERGNPDAQSPYPDYEEESGGAGAIIRDQSARFEGNTQCAQTNSPSIAVPDFEATAVFAVDYLEPDSIRQIS